MASRVWASLAVLARLKHEFQLAELGRHSTQEFEIELLGVFKIGLLGDAICFQGLTKSRESPARSRIQ